MRPILIMVAIAFLVDPALAQSATSIVVGPQLNEILIGYAGVVGTIVAGIISWVLWLVKKKTGFEISAAARKAIDDFAAKKAGELIGRVVNIKDFSIDVRNPTIAMAANEALAHVDVKAALDHLGVGSANVASFVGKFIAAHLGTMTATEPDAPAIPGTDGMVPATAAISAGRASPI